MRHILSTILMVVLAWLAAIVVMPADPFSMLMVMAAILVVAIPSYLLGLRNGAARNRKGPGPGKPDAAAAGDVR